MKKVVNQMEVRNKVKIFLPYLSGICVSILLSLLLIKVFFLPQTMQSVIIANIGVIGYGLTMLTIQRFRKKSRWGNAYAEINPPKKFLRCNLIKEREDH